MKFTVKQSDLSKALDQVAPLASGIDVLKNVIVEVDDKQVFLTGGNESLFLTFSLPAEVGDQGAVAVSASTLRGYVSNLPAGAVTVSQKDGAALVETGTGASATFSGISSSDYPIRPTPKYEGVELPMDNLQSLIDWVIFASASEDAQPPTIGGVSMTVKDGKVVLVATDKFRLARASFKLAEEPEVTYGVILRPKFLSIARKIFKKEEHIKLGVTEGKSWMGFSQNHNVLLNSLIAGDYPDVARLIPDSSSTTALVDRQAMIQVVQRVVALANAETHAIQLSVGDGKIRFGVQSSGVGTAKDLMSAEVSGEPIEISLNGKFLLDILNRSPGEKISLGFTAPLRPILIQPGEGVLSEGWSLDYVLMPLRGDS